MPFHHPGRPEDLPDPARIWALAALTCAVCSGLGSFWPENHRLDDDGLHLEDGGGSWWRMTRVAGGRFLLLGWDRDGSTFRSDELPVDLFADAPGWLPWEWVERTEEVHAPGFAYWWDQTWGRIAYPSWVDEDGLDEQLARCSSVDELVYRLGDLVDTALHDPDYPDGLPELETIGSVIRTLAGAVIAGRVRPESVREALAPLNGALDSTALLEVLGRAGLLTGDRVPPEVPAGTGRPDTRRGPWTISYDAWEDMVTAVARTAPEFARPEPPESESERDLRSWLRDTAARFGGTLTYTALCAGQVSSSYLYDGAGRRVDDPGMTGLDIFGMHQHDHHPERGSWFFLRAHADPEGVTVERAYDHHPDWWRGTGFLSRPGIGPLQREMALRAPEWRPGWVWLLDEEIPHDPPADPFVRPPLAGDRSGGASDA
ncbi:hypothetical protein [Nocardiopsis sp. NPDC006938]|uniref:hypothetical protein n=1 Tax=Nocardiopsis sp. NPDC006938 TaxID=3364337 RepID=UPI0036AC2956